MRRAWQASGESPDETPSPESSPGGEAAPPSAGGAEPGGADRGGGAQTPEEARKVSDSLRFAARAGTVGRVRLVPSLRIKLLCAAFHVRRSPRNPERGPDPGEDRSRDETAGAGSTMPDFTGCVGAPLLGASNFEAVNRMGVRSAATASLSPVSGAALPASSTTFPKLLNFLVGFCGVISMTRVANPALPHDHRFAECAAPRTVRPTPRVSRSTPPRAADDKRFPLRKQWDAQEAVRETLVSHETGGW